MAVEVHPMRVLIIEDDKRLLRALSYFLRQRGLEVTEARDGDQGLAAFQKQQPDLIVVDNSLPGKMGYEVCREVRLQGGEGIPIIMISAFMKVLGVDSQYSDEDLVDGFLRKPFQLGQLWEEISKFRKRERFGRPITETSSESLGKVRQNGESSLPLSGKISDSPLLGVLSRALKGKVTGILTLKEENRVRRIYLANGFPVFARSNLITENLLRYLLRMGEINAETYRRHLSRMQQERWRPGATLVREGVISLTRLNRSHRSLVEEILQLCISWSSATYEFQASQRPVEQAVVYDINPFQVADLWLSKTFTEEQIVERIQYLFSGHLKPSPEFEGWRPLLEWGFAKDQDLESMISEPVAMKVLFEGDASKRSLRARLIQGFLVMGALELELPDSTVIPSNNLVVQALMQPSTTSFQSGSVSRSFSPKAESRSAFSSNSQVQVTSLIKEKGESQQRHLRRIYDVVLRDFRRVLDQASPYEALRVTRTDSIDVIRRRYERFERFYRPENFQRIGDSKLYQLAVEIRQALARAMAEIESEGKTASGIQPTASESSFGTTGWKPREEPREPLAHLFFNDGLTYIRIGDFNEGEAHFIRASEREPGRTTYKAYIIWSRFLKADRSAEAAGVARSALEELIETSPNEDTAYHFLAHIHREEGDLEKAVTCYRRAAELNPDNRSARLFLERLSGTSA